MASGFIILSDGRCWARRWTAYDYLLEITAQELGGCKEEMNLKLWLQSLIPGENDTELGWGFLKKDTEEKVTRNLDLRELTPTNQQMFWAALQRATTKLITASGEKNEHFIFELKRILRMRRLALIRDSPDNLSDWVKGHVEPSSGKRIGPGW